MSPMIITNKKLPRRTVLRGLGAAIALPLLDGMIPAFGRVARAAALPTRRLGVIYAPNERADDERARPRGQQRLGGVEAQRHVGANAVLRQPVDRLQPFGGTWNLDDHIRVPLRILFALADHPCGVERDCLGADWPVDKCRDLLDGTLEIGALLLRY